MLSCLLLFFILNRCVRFILTGLLLSFSLLLTSFFFYFFFTLILIFISSLLFLTLLVASLLFLFFWLNLSFLSSLLFSFLFHLLFLDFLLLFLFLRFFQFLFFLLHLFFLWICLSIFFAYWSGSLQRKLLPSRIAIWHLFSPTGLGCMRCWFVIKLSCRFLRINLRSGRGLGLILWGFYNSSREFRRRQISCGSRSLYFRT